VVFIETHCLKLPTAEELAKMSQQERQRWAYPQLVRWAQPNELARRSAEDLSRLPQTSKVGTGFFVQILDDRLPGQFLYLVTNRHVFQPGVERRNPCTVLFHRVFQNHKGATKGAAVSLQNVFLPADRTWLVPDDRSVDLAAAPYAPDPDQWEYTTVSQSLFVTPDEITNEEVVEGDPVMFAGLFIQYSGINKLEPILRSGAVAMLPVDKIETTLRVPGNVFLVETHSFGGNSGSPVFVDTAKFKTGFLYNYKLLGILAGMVNETSDFKLQPSTVYEGTLAANSGISIIVPAEELRKLLYSSAAQKLRDDAVEKQKIKKP
jgi:hypothetical protein